MLSPDARNRIVLIAIVTVLMASLVYVFGESLRAGQREAHLPSAPQTTSPSPPMEAGTFRRSMSALSYLDAPAVVRPTRTLETFYARRAYPGAPPTVPHAVDDSTFGGKSCLVCHADGGYAPAFSAFAPMTPHPEMLNCRQCHVTPVAAGLFRPTTWWTPAPPAIEGAWLPGAPPPMPHPLRMRQDCLACHAGPGAVEEIRIDHPERVNCRQCHVSVAIGTAWVRPEGAE